MKTNNDEIRQANRKALPKFILSLVICFLVGGGIGFCAAWFGLERLAEGLTAAGELFSRHIAHWLLLACAIAIFAVSLPLYFSAKRELMSWDGEDEAVSGRAEGKLSIALWVSSIIQILAMFLLAASYAGDFEEMTPSLLVALVSFFVVLAGYVVIQQKMVDLAKRINPEKQGSVYDTNFQKKWLDSCDEAEKILLGQCAYKAYSAVNMTCLALWVLFTLTALFLDTGFLPVLAVCVIWGVSQSVYCWQSIKLSRPGSSVLN